MDGKIFLTTARLYLRRLTMEDVDLLYALDSDPEVMRHISKGQPTPRVRIAQEILPRWLRYYDTAAHLGFWAVHTHAGAEFLGWVHLRPDRASPPTLELGYRLKRPAWGRGYATEGARAVLHHAFGVPEVGRVVARTLIDNRASRRVMEKCGLQLERYFTYDAALLPGWTVAERRAVQYGIRRYG